MLDYLDKIARATSLETVWDIHCAAMTDHGFDRLIYGHTRCGTGATLGAFEDALFLTNHDPAYIEGYLQGKAFLKAPMLRWGRENVGACSWGALWRDRETLSAEEQAVIAYNETMGVTAGYSVRFAEADPRSFGMISLTARAGLDQDDADRIWAEQGREIEAKNHVVHLKIRALPHTTARGRLSRRQQEVLCWVGEGKSNQDIAEILGVSVATVEKHLRLAREHLGVETTAQALLKASFMNQIVQL